MIRRLSYHYPRMASLVLLGFIFLTASRAAQAATVDLELVRLDGARQTTLQQWVVMLGEAGFDHVQIRNRQRDDAIEVIQGGSERSPRYRVIGLLDGQDRITLPGGKFSLRDQQRIATWVRTLKEHGPEGVTAGTGAFGMTEKKLAEVMDDLARPIDFSTAGANAIDVLTKISEQLTYPVALSPTAQKALASETAIRDELQGLSSGTAIAAIVRPAGLAMRPVKKGRQIDYMIDRPGKDEIWPIGFAATESNGRTIPALLSYERTQDVKVPLGPGLAQVQKRVDVPFLYDYNALAAARVDLDTVEVSMRAGKMHYGRILRGLLFQAKLKYEVRLDEADTPFIWITGAK